MRSKIRRGVLVGWCSVLTVAGLLGACGHGDTDEEVMRSRCGELRDHLVDLQLQSATADREAHRAALMASLGSNYVDECVHERTRADLDCGIAAKSPSDVVSCFSGKGGGR
jgi:hypothetical protein